MLIHFNRRFAPLRGQTMTLTIDAVYEDGVIKPAEPLPFKHEKVRVTVEAATGWVDATYGILGWKGDPEELRRLAIHPELDLEDEP